MICDILSYGRSELRTTCTPIETVDDRVRELADTLLKTMYASQGLGLAAQQIGRCEAICVVDEAPPVVDRPMDMPREHPDIPMPLVLINPRILESSGKQTGDEGCLSFPEIFVSVTRAQEIVATYLDLDGHQQTITVHGLLARAIQHEVDHLNGVLLVDHMSPVQKIALAGKLRRLKRANQPA